MVIYERDIAVDMGTSNTLVFVQGKGLVLREPTVVALNKTRNDPEKDRMLKIGEEAKKTLGRTPANIVAIHPIRDGVISDYDMSALMLRELVSRITSFSLFKPRLLMCVPSSITGVEERAVLDAAVEAGARKVYLVETAVATAIGAGVDIKKPDGHMVIDIGGGTTEIAVVTMGGVAECESIKIAGSSFDEAIIRYIKKKHNVLIGAMTAEEVKISIGGLIPRPDAPESMEVKGRCLVKGLPKTVTVTAAELIEVLREPARLILENVHSVLERTPPELTGDLGVNGIILSGGGSMLYGIDKMIEHSTEIKTMIVDDPIACAAHGAGKLLSQLDYMQDGMMNFLRNREMRR